MVQRRAEEGTRTPVPPSATNDDGETERVRRIYDKLAPGYDRLIGVAERLLFGNGRAWVCARAGGETLEVGVGTGRNLVHYPEDARLTGVELSPGMLEVARRRARRLGRLVDLRLGDAQALDFPADRFDTVVFTLALCSIPDDRRAVAEARRVLRPGGRLLLLEHVRSRIRLVRDLQGLLDRLTVRFEGDHLLREPLLHVRAGGFEIEEVERSKWGIVERLAARKSASPPPEG